MSFQYENYTVSIMNMYTSLVDIDTENKNANTAVVYKLVKIKTFLDL